MADRPSTHVLDRSRIDGEPSPDAGVDGFSLIELLITLLIIGILAAIILAAYQGAIDRSRINRAIAEIDTLEKEIAAFEVDHGHLPDSLDDIGRGSLADPWGHRYRYLRLRSSGDEGGGGAPPGRARKFRGPVNRTYDLYSVGKDGDTRL